MESVGAGAPDHRAVISGVFGLGRAGVERGAANSADIVACDRKRAGAQDDGDEGGARDGDGRGYEGLTCIPRPVGDGMPAVYVHFEGHGGSGDARSIAQSEIPQGSDQAR